jgi:hypothetical protein
MITSTIAALKAFIWTKSHAGHLPPCKGKSAKPVRTFIPLSIQKIDAEDIEYYG